LSGKRISDQVRFPLPPAVAAPQADPDTAAGAQRFCSKGMPRERATTGALHREDPIAPPNRLGHVADWRWWRESSRAGRCILL